MRQVDRKAVQAPASLTSPNGKGDRELQEARTHYGNASQSQSTFLFKAYKADDVSRALTALFHGKCAYCESVYAGTQPMDVEHFRPKGGVEEKPDHPGYWWLAMKWENLLPSCIDCNRRRRQVTVDLRFSYAELEASFKEVDGVSIGKKDSFPTANNWWAFGENESVDQEDALLIDPTRDDPKEYFEWHFNESVCVVLPTRNSADEENVRGVASIFSYGLNRSGLVLERTQLMLILRFLRETIIECIDGISDPTVPPYLHLKFQTILQGSVRKIDELSAPERAYSSMVKAFKDQLISDLEGAIPGT